MPIEWTDYWMLDDSDDKNELMHLNKNVKLPRKMPEPLQEYIDNIFKAFDEGNMGMYTFLEDCIEPETKKMLCSRKISQQEKDLIFKMLGWYVD